jgi:hypothetical protein
LIHRGQLWSAWQTLYSLINKRCEEETKHACAGYEAGIAISNTAMVLARYAIDAVSALLPELDVHTRPDMQP